MTHTKEIFWHYWVPVLVMLALIKLESTDTMSGEHTSDCLRQLLHWAGVQLSGQRLELLNMLLRKGGHMIGYGLLCFFWLMLLRGTYWLRHGYTRSVMGGVAVRRILWRAEWATVAVLSTFLVAASDELHQMSIPSRTGTWRDVALDTTAGLITAAVVWARAAWLCRDEPATVVGGQHA